MQKNPGAKTIEGDLEEALFFSGAVPEQDRGCPKRFDFARSARTDKGVSAVGQVVSGKFYVDPPGFVERLNNNLPPQFRIFGYKRVTASFSAKKFCDRRRYVYLLPVFALDPTSHRDRESVLASVGSENELVKCLDCSERGRKVEIHTGISSNTSTTLPGSNGKSLEKSSSVSTDCNNNSSSDAVNGVDNGESVTAVKENVFSYGDKEKERFNKILKQYEGTHNFHNFTTRTKAADPSANQADIIPSGKLDTKAGLNLDDLEVNLGDLEAELVEINANSEKLQRGYNELVEYKLVLQKAGEFFKVAQSSASEHQGEGSSHQGAEESLETPLLNDQESTVDQGKQVKLGYITGLVAKEKAMAFERILFRATRGNVFLRQSSVDEAVTDPSSGEKVQKSVFVVFFSGERAKSKILKICEAFGANRYPFPEDLSKQAQMITEVSGRLSELKTTIDTGLVHRTNLLETIAKQYEQWNDLVRKEKSIYHTLNMLSIDVTKKCLVAEGWSPIFATQQIQEALQQATIDAKSQVGAIFQVLHTKEMPPTYFRTNKFTESFQTIVDAYGVARYQEANPGVYTVVTFPFLFAVMFGDWGHGICILIAALFLILKEKKYSSQKLGDIMEMTFGGRYVIFLMALFSIYTGLIYNEFFSVPFELFSPSAYACRDDACSEATTIGLIKVGDTYPFGVDPVWHGSRSELPFLNSLKMKMSILLGVAQMNLGIVLSFFNAIYFKNSVNVWFQFIPQMIFLNGLFGYLSLLIILKWITGSKADLYHVMIYMFLSPTDDLAENELFPNQKTVQLVLLLLSLIAVPWMLLPKPFILKAQHNRTHQGDSYVALEGTDESLVEGGHHGSHDHEEEFEFSEVFVHQLIHTIEFVLGAVSNTASYLRLWALSLAHSELSTVFYEKVLLLAWGYNNVIILGVGIIVFVFATVGVLLVMETLSAFLHALRLHWVEFQNKFYEGDGYKFAPFSFALLVNEDE